MTKGKVGQSSGYISGYTIVTCIHPHRDHAGEGDIPQLLPGPQLGLEEGLIVTGCRELYGGM